MEIVGRIANDATVKTIKSGDKQVVNFTVVVNDSYKPKGSGEVKKVATFFQCSYWVNPNIARYLTKGTLVELYGRIGVNAYVNLQGEAQGRLVFHVNNIKLHGKAKEGTPIVQQPAAQLTEPVDDLPF